jgi:uncharacterized protein (TIGR02001 family)
MNKTLAAFSVCAVMSPLAFAETPSDVSDPDLKKPQAVAAAPAAESATSADDNKYPWLKNLSGSLTFVSDYVFRGVSQNNNLPAVQGSMTYSFPINLYFNLWGSNVNFFDSHGNNATVEMDTIIGYHNTYGDNFTYDLSVARYNYPGARFANYNEFNGLMNLYFLQASIGYSKNVYNTHRTGVYYNGGINYDIPSKYAFGICDLTLLALLGHYSLPVAAGDSYNDYNVSLSKAFKTYTVTAQWVSTNGRQHIGRLDDSRFIAQLAASF